MLASIWARNSAIQVFAMISQRLGIAHMKWRAGASFCFRVRISFVVCVLVLSDKGTPLIALLSWSLQPLLQGPPPPWNDPDFLRSPSIDHHVSGILKAINRTEHGQARLGLPTGSPVFQSMVSRWFSQVSVGKHLPRPKRLASLMKADARCSARAGVHLNWSIGASKPVLNSTVGMIRRNAQSACAIQDMTLPRVSCTQALTISLSLLVPLLCSKLVPHSHNKYGNILCLAFSIYLIPSRHSPCKVP